MNKYTELSNFEINKNVFICECEDNCIQYKHIKQRTGNLQLFQRQLKATIKNDNEEAWEETEWIDFFDEGMAMNLVKTNRIAINPRGDVWECGVGWNTVEDKKLTRAICIAYLLKKDSENENNNNS
ncbi:hypothetical protein [Proteus hauseri]|uniref:hypothetical protein n=1 Tax=Proteus hauseri TaxID=183417 RepID=UPI0010096D71|nr:hypothetical protein [Proteus hauseri]QAV22375.1 hypothetical protein PH4a_03045 [Proteus hauseri]